MAWRWRFSLSLSEPTLAADEVRSQSRSNDRLSWRNLAEASGSIAKRRLPSRSSLTQEISRCTFTVTPTAKPRSADPMGRRGGAHARYEVALDSRIEWIVFDLPLNG